MTRISSSVAGTLALVALLGNPAWAEKADRTQPLVVESESKKAVSVDLAKKATVIEGNVAITQGSLQIKADRVEIKEDAQGHFQALATANAGRQASFRQKRDKVNEFMEGLAERIEYDGSAERVRLSGNARLRLIRPGFAPDEASAPVIVYDQKGDTLTFEGSTGQPGVSKPATLVFVPRAAAASEPARKGTP